MTQRKVGYGGSEPFGLAITMGSRGVSTGDEEDK